MNNETIQNENLNNNVEKGDVKPNKSKKNPNFKLITLIAVIIALITGFIIFNGKVKDINMEIVDTNASISKNIDAFLEENSEKPGVHSIRDGEYTYVLITSEKIKATEMSINLYDIYKKGFNVTIEYEVEVNESTISDNNPERVQKMLVRFKESGKVKPVIKKLSEQQQ